MTQTPNTKTADQSVDEYITQYDGLAKDRLVQIRQILVEVMPEAEQKIGYGMPTFKIGGHNAFHFAAFKNHVSIFPSSHAIEHFAKELEDYKYSDGTIQFQNNEPLPTEFIRKIAIWRKEFMKEDNPEKS